MQTYISLLVEFFKTGLFAVGGGLATIPFLKAMAEEYRWFTLEQLTDMIAVSESSPGPIGVNMATYTGWSIFGIPGAISATIALVFPSVVVVAIVSRFLKRFRDSQPVKNAFYALKPCSAALIAGAMFPVFISTVITPLSLFSNNSTSVNAVPLIIYVIFTVACFYFENRKKPLHPIIFIGAGAVLGVVFGVLGIEL